MATISEAFRIAHENHRAGQLQAAEQVYRQILAADPNHAEALHWLGVIAYQTYNYEAAIELISRSIELVGNNSASHSNLGLAWYAQGKLDHAVNCFRRAMELTSDSVKAFNSLVLVLQYHANVTLFGLAAIHAVFEDQHAAPLRTFWQCHENDRDPERPLRLGFVSPDFGRHPVGYFLIRVLENLDGDRCQVVCYSDRTIRDDLTNRINAASTLWREVSGLNDELLAKQIRADRIDILFDLAGHTEGNRLLVFARKPAPIQVTWAGYVGTTGLAAMDYILADRYEIPPEAEVHYRERVMRMPDGYVCYEPPAVAPDVLPLPALTEGNVKFGSFNNPAKISSEVVAVWAKILNRLPWSRLVLKHRGMNDTSIVSRLAEEFASHGVESGRVEYLGWSPHETLLAEYNRIDLALDPFPYNGGLTTCEALWMGVPVITCSGETFASRHSLSHLSNVGLTETIARDLDKYVEIAVALATDLPRLAALRCSLRSRVASSPLCDGPRFAQDFMHILRGIWQQWCQKESVVGG